MSLLTGPEKKHSLISRGEAMKFPLWVAIIVVVAGLLTSAEILVTSSSEADRISELPGQPKVSFQQFSGYIIVDERQERALFYYFVEAETDPASKPLVVWFNGGPGCSSIGVGAFSEHGPFRPSGDILVRNEYSWNKEANMLHVESPAGVGFSYSTNASYYTMVDDEMTAKDNLRFLKGWFLKFPEYKNRDLFITGESYAGHYVPQLALLIVQSEQEEKFNLKGISLGNPLLEYNTDFNSVALYFWSHGLISDSTYIAFTTICNNSRIQSELFRGNISPVCAGVAEQVNAEITREYVDLYDVTLDVCLSSIESQSKALIQSQYEDKIDVCVDDETRNYLNRNDVQKALHALLVGVTTTWSPCSNVVQYQMLDLEIPTIHILGSLIRSGIRVMVYSGDQDSVIPLTGSRTLIHKLADELGLNTTVSYRAWFSQKQVGGWTQVYGNILSFATIKGASHKAPFSQPERSLAVFSSFLEGKPLPEAF